MIYFASQLKQLLADGQYLEKEGRNEKMNFLQEPNAHYS